MIAGAPPVSSVPPTEILSPSGPPVPRGGPEGEIESMTRRPFGWHPWSTPLGLAEDSRYVPDGGARTPFTHIYPAGSWESYTGAERYQVGKNPIEYGTDAMPNWGWGTGSTNDNPTFRNPPGMTVAAGEGLDRPGASKAAGVPSWRLNQL